jgi:hypothetical protein
LHTFIANIAPSQGVHIAGEPAQAIEIFSLVCPLARSVPGYSLVIIAAL